MRSMFFNGTMNQTIRPKDIELKNIVPQSNPGNKSPSPSETKPLQPASPIEAKNVTQELTPLHRQ